MRLVPAYFHSNKKMFPPRLRNWGKSKVEIALIAWEIFWGLSYLLVYIQKHWKENTQSQNIEHSYLYEKIISIQTVHYFNKFSELRLQILPFLHQMCASEYLCYIFIMKRFHFHTLFPKISKIVKLSPTIEENLNRKLEIQHYKYKIFKLNIEKILKQIFWENKFGLLRIRLYAADCRYLYPPLSISKISSKCCPWFTDKHKYSTKSRNYPTFVVQASWTFAQDLDEKFSLTLSLLGPISSQRCYHFLIQSWMPVCALLSSFDSFYSFL